MLESSSGNESESNESIDLIMKPIILTPIPATKQANEKPFKCPFSPCTYSTNRKGHFEDHERSHTGEKLPCKVEGCKKSFFSKSGRCRHEVKCKPKYNC